MLDLDLLTLANWLLYLEFKGYLFDELNKESLPLPTTLVKLWSLHVALIDSHISVAFLHADGLQLCAILLEVPLLSLFALFAVQLHVLMIFLVKFVDSQKVFVLMYLLYFGCVRVISEHEEHLLSPSKEHLGAFANLFVQLVIAHTINGFVEEGERASPVLCLHVVAHVHQRLTGVNLHVLGVLINRQVLLVIDPALEVISDLLVLVGHSIELHLIQLLAFLVHEFLEFFGKRS